MALSQVYTAVIGHVITAARWNNEFGNIYANGTDLAFPLTKAVSLAGYTLTIDAAGVTTLSSSTAQAFIFTPGSKSGTPGVNGSFFNFAAGTFTDSNTAVSGTAALWSGSTFRAPTLNATNATVTTTDACTVYIEGAPTAGTNETFTETSALFVNGKVKCSGDFRLRGEDSRTNTIVEPMTVQMTTSGIPAAGIGTGIAILAESADENPCSIGTLDFELTDVAAGSEDSRFRIKTRVAGAVLAETYSWQATGAFSAKMTHANTADRTYTLPNRNNLLDVPDTAEFLTSGTTWNVPAGVTRVYAEVYGASGGGGGGGESNSGNDGAAGGAGGTTSFGALSTTGGGAGPGGYGGTSTGAGKTPAALGVASGGTVLLDGSGRPGGAGGGGGYATPGQSGFPGGNGAYVAGYVSVTPGGTVTYAIGAAGTAGAGGAGAAGSDGAAGLVGLAGRIVLRY